MAAWLRVFGMTPCDCPPGALDAAQKRVSELESAPELLVTKGRKGERIRYRDLERVELAGTSLVQSEVIFK